MENEEEIRILRNAYAKEWRKRNPEKVKATNRGINIFYSYNLC